MRSSACVMRLRTAEAAETACRIASATLFLLALDFQQRCGRCRGFLLPSLRFLLSAGDIDVGRLQRGAIGLQLLLQSRELLFGVGDFCLCAGGARIQFGSNALRWCGDGRRRDPDPAQANSAARDSPAPSRSMA